MGLVLITPAAASPVTLAEAKTHCRVDGSDEDTLITGLIAAATNYVEQYTGRAIGAQTWRLTQDTFSDNILLPMGPVQSISSVQYYDTAGVLQTVASSVYTLDADSDPAWLVRNANEAWPATLNGINAVRVTYVTGYATIPAAVKQAILLLIADWYNMRENTTLTTNQPTEMPHAVTALLANFRSYGV